jgi:hypothetical protein
MKIPCEECILIPICRKKHFDIMVNNCSLLKTVLMEEGVYPYNLYIKHKSNKRYHQILVKLEDALKPSLWKTVGVR